MSGSASGFRLLQTRQAPRAPLLGSRCYLDRQGVPTPSAGATPPSSLLRTHAPVLRPPLASAFRLVLWVFAGCYQPLLGIAPSRRYLCESFLTCLDPYPGGPQGAFARFFPQGFGLPRSLSGSALHNNPGQPLLSSGSSRGCSHFVMFTPASLLATQVAPTAVPFRARGSRGFYVWAPHGSLPPRSPDMLGVRIEQLTPGRLALPKIRSLVGCSGRPRPFPNPINRPRGRPKNPATESGEDADQLDLDL